MTTPLSHSVTAAVLAAAFSTGIAAQGGQFLNLPSGAGSAFAVSDDGSIAAGYGSNGVFRWTTGGGTQYLNNAVASIVDMSADGSVISCNMPGSTAPSGMQEAAFWTLAGGWQAIGGINPTGCGSLSSAYGLSADGSVLVGLGWEGCNGRAFRWESSTGVVSLGVTGPHSSRANTVSGDGQVIGGWDEAQNGQRRAAVWFPGAPSAILIIPPSANNPVGAGEVWGINGDGSVIVGGESGDQAWRWTTAGGFERLGTYPGGQPGDTGTAYATNADGSMIVGVSGGFFTGYGPFMWTKEDGMQKLSTYLEAQSIATPAGPVLTWAFDISPSGYHIVGRRGDFRMLPGEVAFWIELPPGMRYGVQLGGTNTMRLTGTGSTALGGSLTVTTDNLPGPNPLTSTLVGLGSTRTPLFGGTLLVDLSLPHLVVNIPAAAGAAAFSLPIPQVPAIIGASLYMQTVVVDPNVTGGMAFSSGIKATVTG